MTAKNTERVQTSTNTDQAPTSNIFITEKKKIHLSATCGYNSLVLTFQYYFSNVKWKTIENGSN